MSLRHTTYTSPPHQTDFAVSYVCLRNFINKKDYVYLDQINKNVYTHLKLNRQEEEVKQSELRRWLAAQGAEFKDGTNHLKIYLNGKQTVMPRHPGKEIPEPLRKAILKQLGIK